MKCQQKNMNKFVLDVFQVPQIFVSFLFIYILNTKNRILDDYLGFHCQKILLGDCNTGTER
jgi:hypothetical protein